MLVIRTAADPASLAAPGGAASHDIDRTVVGGTGKPGEALGSDSDAVRIVLVGGNLRGLGLLVGGVDVVVGLGEAFFG